VTLSRPTATRRTHEKGTSMSRRMLVLVAGALLAAGCGAADTADTTTTEPPVETSTTIATPTTAATSTTSMVIAFDPTSTTSSTLPPAPEMASVDPLAWGLFCRDLVDAGWDYEGAVAYWNVEGRPARMDADENGIPCETVYPASDVTAYWGDPLPTGLAPGPGSGWRSTDLTPSVAKGCCGMNDNGPVSPPLPPAAGPYPDDGPYSVAISRSPAPTDDLTLEVRRWLPCADAPDRCAPDAVPGDVYADPEHAVVRTVPLDSALRVVIRSIGHVTGNEWTEPSIEGDGSALATLFRRYDAAWTYAAPLLEGENDLLTRGRIDPTFPYGPSPGEEWVLGYRGPAGSYLTTNSFAMAGQDRASGWYHWWPTLEVIDGTPVLFLWAGQIAG